MIFVSDGGILRAELSLRILVSLARSVSLISGGFLSATCCGKFSRLLY